MRFPRTQALLDHVHYYLRTWEYLRRNLHSHKATSPIYPTIIQIGTHNRCNGRCQMCPYPHTVGEQPKQEISRELVAKIFSEIAEWKIARKHAGVIVFTLQNEPLLDKRIPEFMRDARAKLGSKWEIEVTTNGTLLSGAIACEIARAEPWAVNVSVNGFTQTTYDVTMPGFSVEAVFKNIEEFIRLKSKRTKLFIRYVKQRANDAEFRDLQRYWNARGVAVIGYGCNDRLGNVKNYDGIKSTSVGVLGGFLRRKFGSRVFSVCPFLFCQANILPSGSVLMCCHDYRYQALLGDLGSLGEGFSLYTIFNTSSIWQIRQDAQQGSYSGICLQCSLFKTHVWL